MKKYRIRLELTVGLDDPEQTLDTLARAGLSAALLEGLRSQGVKARLVTAGARNITALDK